MKNFFDNRRFKHGSLATVITIFVIIAVVIINIVATMLLERYPLNIDLTKDNRFELTQDSVSFIKNLEDEVTITACVDEMKLKTLGDWYKQVYEILKSYTKYGNKVNLKFVDLSKEPTFAQKYTNFTVVEGDFIVETSLRNRKVSINDIIRYQQTDRGEVIYSSEAEQVLTAALMYVTDKNPISASVLTGIDNVSLAAYTDVLARNNYEITEQSLLTDTINPDANLIIMGAPAVDLTIEQVKQIEAFLDNDGKFDKSMIFVASKDRPVGPILKTFLADWGMEVDSGILFETNSANAIYNNYTMVNRITDPEILEGMKSQTLPVIVSYANPIKRVFESDDNRKTDIILGTSDSNVIEPLIADAGFDLNQQERNSYSTIVRCTKTAFYDGAEKKSTVVAFGSADMLTTNYINNAAFSNGDASVLIANQLTKKKDAITMLPITFADETITITKEQLSVFTAVFIFILPLAILALGTFIFLRRRHL